jgi:2-polyprenyl-3-methyl-5-hydroxy-6-metoxy-1,4-benzoquinol methylase
VTRSADVAGRINRRRWNELAAKHGDDPVYRVDEMIGGRETLGPVESDLLGDIAGLRVLHMQCHIGLDSVSLARRGARVTAIDFSSTAVERARDIAGRCGVDVDFRVADCQIGLPELNEQFDVVFASHGVLHWISDVGAWMATAVRALRPAGRLVLVDFHSIYLMLGSIDPLQLAYPYSRGEPVLADLPTDYTDGAPVSARSAVYFMRSPIEVAAAALEAGLNIVALAEIYRHHHPGKPFLTCLADDEYALRVGKHELPISYSLVASRGDQCAEDGR